MRQIADSISELVFYLCLTTVILAATYGVVRVIIADGKSDYCTVEQASTGQFVLKQHVPWRSDRFIDQTCKTVEEAKVKADLIGCTVK